MEILKLILLATALVSLAMLALAVRILIKKGGKFPNTHVSGNKYLKKNGIYCYQAQDKIAQREARKEIKFSELTISPDIKAGK